MVFVFDSLLGSETTIDDFLPLIGLLLNLNELDVLLKLSSSSLIIPVILLELLLNLVVNELIESDHINRSRLFIFPKPASPEI